MRKSKHIETTLLIISHLVLVASIILNIFQFRVSQRISSQPLIPIIDEHYIYMKGDSFIKFKKLLERKMDFNLFPSPSFALTREYEELLGWINNLQDKKEIENSIIKFAVIRNSSKIPIKDLKLSFDNHNTVDLQILDGNHSFLVFLGKTKVLRVTFSRFYKPISYLYNYNLWGDDIEVKKDFHKESGKAVSFELDIGPINRAYLDIDDLFIKRYEKNSNDEN